MKRFIEKHLKIYHTEFSAFVWLGSIVFAIVYAEALVRNYADAAFLKYCGPEYLPWIWIAGSVLSIGLIGWIAQWAQARRDDVLLSALLLICAITGLFLLAAIQAGYVYAYAALSIMLQVLEAIGYVFVWNLSGDLFHARQAKRIFPAISSAMVLGKTAGSFSTKIFDVVLGASSTLLIFGISSLAVALFLAITGGKFVGVSAGQPRAAQPGSQQKSIAEVAGLMRSYPLLRYLMLSSLIPSVLLPMFNFQFMVIVHSTFPSEHDMILFFSIFRGLIPVVTLSVMFVLGQRYAKMNLADVSLINPINFSVMFGGLAGFFNIFVAAYGSFSARLIQNTIASPVQNVLCEMLPAKIATWSRSFVRGTCVKFGGLCGCLLVLLLDGIVRAQGLSLIAEMLALLLLIETLAFRRHYRQILKTSLIETKLDFDQLDAADRFFGSDSPDRLGSHAYGRPSGTETGFKHNHEWTIDPDTALKLLDSPDLEERAKAALSCAVRKDMRAVRKLVGWLELTHYDLRDAALHALQQYGEDILPFLEVCLVRSSPRVKLGILEVIRLAGLGHFQGLPFINGELIQAYGNLLSYRCLESLEPAPSIEMLKSCLLEENDEILRRIFYGLWVRHADMRLMYESLKSEQRAMALELLESSIGTRMASRLAPLLEDIPLDSRIQRLRELQFLIEEDDPERLLTFLVNSSDPVTRRFAVHVAGDRLLGPSFIPSIEACNDDGDPRLREMAAFALARLSGRPAEVPPLIDTIRDLEKFRAFAGIGVRGREEVGSVAKRERFAPGAVIVQEGHPALSIYFVVSGTILMYHDYGGPHEKLSHSIGPASSTGTWTWLKGAAAEATFVASEETEALRVSVSDFEEMMRLFPQISINVCGTMCRHLSDRSGITC